MQLIIKLTTKVLIWIFILVSHDAICDLTISIDNEMEKANQVQSQFDNLKGETFIDWTHKDKFFKSTIYEINYNSLDIFHSTNSKGKNKYTRHTYGGSGWNPKPRFSDICEIYADLPKSSTAHPFAPTYTHNIHKIDLSDKQTELIHDRKNNTLDLKANVGQYGVQLALIVRFDRETEKYVSPIKSNLETIINFCKKNRISIELLRTK
jgi:hypothetical protein